METTDTKATEGVAKAQERLAKARERLVRATEANAKTYAKVCEKLVECGIARDKHKKVLKTGDRRQIAAASDEKEMADDQYNLAQDALLETIHDKSAARRENNDALASLVRCLQATGDVAQEEGDKLQEEYEKAKRKSIQARQVRCDVAEIAGEACSASAVANMALEQALETKDPCRVAEAMAEAEAAALRSEKADRDDDAANREWCDAEWREDQVVFALERCLKAATGPSVSSMWQWLGWRASLPAVKVTPLLEQRPSLKQKKVV